MREKQKTRVLRGAMIGFGNVAVNAHVPAWQKNPMFTIDAVVEPDPERARLATELIPGASVYSHMDDAVARGNLDFVDICAPPSAHADLVEKACGAGLHVICEKPLVTSFEQLEKIEAATRPGCVVFTVNNWKHAPLWMKMRELLSKKSIGPIRSVFLAVLRPPNSGGGVSGWRQRVETAGGGILLDHGWHQLYLLRLIMNRGPLAICAKMEYSAGIEEEVDLLIRFPAGEARVHLTWRAPSRQNQGRIEGKKGTILINDDHLVTVVSKDSVIRHDFGEALSGGSHHPSWMENVVEDFRREIFNEKARGANLTEAKWCARLIDSAYKSSREGSSDVRLHGPVS